MAGNSSRNLLPRNAEGVASHVEVIPATADQEPIAANLLELYAYDFSEFLDLKLGADGRFGYKHLPLYWREPNHHPFLVRVDGQLAGLVLIKRGSDLSNNDTIWDVAEFFVLRGYRRRGFGSEIARQIWRRFPGWWEVRVMESNHAAHQFWERAIRAFTGQPVQSARMEKGGEGWRVFAFESVRVP